MRASVITLKSQKREGLWLVGLSTVVTDESLRQIQRSSLGGVGSIATEMKVLGIDFSCALGALANGHFPEKDCLLPLISKLLGYAIVAASTTVKLPQARFYLLLLLSLCQCLFVKAIIFLFSFCNLC